jgi:hypothetical protein
VGLGFGERGFEFFAMVGHLELRELFDDVFGGAEEDAGVGFGEHGGVVVGVAGGG